jgi:hypothetical protein
MLSLLLGFIIFRCCFLLVHYKEPPSILTALERKNTHGFAMEIFMGIQSLEAFIFIFSF